MSDASSVLKDQSHRDNVHLARPFSQFKKGVRRPEQVISD
jgi:hypothetical protein